MYKSVLVGTDGSETAEAAVKVALEMAERFGSEVHVVNVARPLVAGTDVVVPFAEGLDAYASELADEVASRARAKNVEVHTHVMVGDPVERIVTVAEEQGVDLIVVGNKGMRGVRRLLGSIPNGIAHKAPCAVLIVKTT